MQSILRVQPASLAAPASFAGRALIVAAAYFAAAKLALWAGIVPDQTGALWPASGVALAGVLLLGYSVWPGVWLGAALIEATIQSSPLAAALISAGSTLGALAAASLVRRCIGLPRSFEHGGDV